MQILGVEGDAAIAIRRISRPYIAHSGRMADGAKTPYLPSDAYATGHTLFALV